MKNLINPANAAKKRLFFILVTTFIVVNAVAVEDSISPTACGITVGQTTKTGKTLAEWSDILKDYRPMNPIVTQTNQEVYFGDFVVEGFHMPLLNMQLINDTVYKLAFYESSPYSDCWDSYKDLAFKIRDKYAHFEDVGTPYTSDNDSVVHFFKTDGKTQILFSAYPQSISIILVNEHLHDIYVQTLFNEFNSLVIGKNGPNYDEKNKVTSIAGVRFGETRTKTINAFKQRGTFIKNENKSTYFSNVDFGGSVFSLATLFFEYNSKRFDNVLAAAKFEKNFNVWRREEALMMYEAVIGRYQEKYTNYKVIKDEEDSKLVVCGMIEDDYEEGKIPPIMILFDLGVSRGGDKFYYVSVSYFVQRMSNEATNDI